MKFYRHLILCLLFIWSSNLLAAPLEIISVRTSSLAATSRLVFEMTENPHYVLFSLSDPERLVLDIKNARLSAPLNKSILTYMPIKNLRGKSYQDYLRIVIDLKQPVKTQSFVLAPDKKHRFRLIVDLLTATKTKPTLAVLPPPITKTFWHLAAKKTQTNHPVVNTVFLPPTVKPMPVQNSLITTHKNYGRNIVIVVDPGHGGKDPGTTGPRGTREKDVVLAISKDLQRALNNEPGFHAELTRSGDNYIPLRGRLDIARKDQADMFIAIHADAYQNSDAMGASVFALSERGATSEAARWLAEKENKSELLGGASLPDNDNVLRSVLIDLSQTNTISESLQIGTAVLHQLGNVTTLHHDRVEQAAFVVLKSPDIPSLLVETGFLSTSQQEQQLRNSKYQQLIANAIMQGIKSYFVRNPPQGTKLSAR